MAKTILLVDDDADILDSMQAALGPLGAEMVTARDGNEALAQAGRHAPDLVILDMMLPRRSGFLVLQQLKKSRQKGGKPLVIMITANEGTRHRQYAESLGVDDYINKPFRMERLVDSARALLGEE